MCKQHALLICFPTMEKSMLRYLAVKSHKASVLRLFVVNFVQGTSLLRKSISEGCEDFYSVTIENKNLDERAWTSHGNFFDKVWSALILTALMPTLIRRLFYNQQPMTSN